MLSVSLATADEIVKPPFEYYKLDKKQMVWGGATNDIKAGLIVSVFTNQSDVKQNGVWCVGWLLFTSNSATKFYVGYTNSNSNCFIGAHEGTRWDYGQKAGEHYLSQLTVDAYRLLPMERNYQVSLTDADGRHVARTDLGETFRHSFYDNPVLEGDFGSNSLETGEVTIFLVIAASMIFLF